MEVADLPEGAPPPGAPVREEATGRFAAANPGPKNALEEADNAFFAEHFAKDFRDALTPGHDAAPEGASGDEEEQPEAGSEQSEPPAGKAPAQASESAAIKAARTALARAGVPQRVIDGISEKELPEWQTTLTRVSETDNAYRELGELRKAKEKSAPVTESAKAEQPDDLEADLQPIAEALDEEASKRLGILIKKREAALAAKNAALEARIAKIEAATEESETARLHTIVEETRAGLSGRFPQVKDPEIWTPAMRMAAKLNADGEFAGKPAELFTAALRAMGLSEVADSKAPPQPPPRRNAPPPPVTNTNRHRPGPPKTLDELDSIVLAEIERENAFARRG